MPAPRFNSRASHTGLILGALGVAAYLWSMLCAFPSHSWNAVRLAPTFMIHAGQTPYPTLAEGPLTTWIYGPVALFLQWPATFAGDAVTAVLAAAVINCAVLLLPLVIALRSEGKLRPFALLVVIVFLPSSCWQFWQSDNAAFALGLLANAALFTGSARAAVLAALLTALAVWSKQTELPLVLAQAGWLLWMRGRGPALRYVAMCAGFGLGLGALFILWFGLEGFWFNLVTLPGRIPFAPLTGKLHDLTPAFLAYGLLPLLLVWRFRRTIRQSPAFALGALSFATLLPFAVISFFKVGGSVNSLHSTFYLLPGAALALTAWLDKKTYAAPLFIAATVVAMSLVKADHYRGTFRPQTQALKQGAYLAASFPCSIYIPWNPLLTAFSDHRFYHAEDGLSTRLAAGYAFTPASLRAHLPERLSVVAYSRDDPPGFMTGLLPARARHDRFGEWDLYSWELAPSKP